MNKKACLSLMLTALLAGSLYAQENVRNPPDTCDPETQFCGCPETESGANNGCVHVTLMLGQTSVLSDRRDVQLKIFSSAASPSLATPEALNVVMGYTFQHLGSAATAAGAPASVNFVQPTGEKLEFTFAEGSSLGVPTPGIYKELPERVQMVDANGWATLTEPVYYDLYPGDGSVWRFMATDITGELGQLITYTDPRGRVLTNDDFGVDIVRAPNGLLRQVLTPSRLADIVLRGATGYTVTVYPLTALPAFVNGRYTLPLHPATEVLTVDRGEDINHLIVTLQKGGATPERYAYTYVNGEWSLTRPDGVIDQKEIYYSDDEDAAQLVHLIKDAAGHVRSQQRYLYVFKSWGYAATNRVEGFGAATRSTSWSYNTSGAAKGKVSQTWDSTGEVVQYGYDANGRKISITYPNRSETVTTSYAPVDPADQMLLNDLRPRTVIRTINTIEVERTYYAYLPTQEIVERVATPGAAYGAEGNLRTVTTWYPAADDDHSAGRVQSVRYEDGQIDVYTYSWVNSIWTETVTRVHEDELDPVAMQTTRRSRIYSRIGTLTEERTELMTAPGVWEQIDGTAYAYTVAGNESKRTTFNGLITTSEWAGTCCGKSSETAPDGTRTTFTYDASGRLIVRTVLDPNPIETHIAYDTLGRQITTWTTNRVAQLGTTPLRTTYDALGRVTSRTDQLGNTTTYSYSADESTTTLTNPIGSTQITVTDESGRILALSGTAVAPRTYTYGVNADGSQWTEVYQGTDATALAWNKATHDLLGRTIQEEKPGYSGTTLVMEYGYDSSGRLVTQAGSFQPVVTYAYNAFGERITTLQTVTNAWRKTEQHATYERACGELWQVATTVQSCSDASIAPLASASRRQLTGLTAVNPSWTKNVDVRGNVSESWTEFDSDTKVQSSYRRVPYAKNLEVSHTRFGQTIETVSLSGVTNTPSYDGLGRVVSAMDGRGNTTTFSYNSKGERVCIIDAATNVTWYAFDNFGRLASVTNALGEVTVYEYNLQGRKTYEGGGTYPVRYVYDDQGRMTSMTTYRDESGQGDTTVWTYDDASGVLLSKTYADNKGPSYTYTPDGKLATRTWARGVTTTYTYDDWGNLTGIVDSDGTSSVSMAYDVMGRQVQTSDAVGVTAFSYDSFSSLTNETVAGQYAKSLDRHVDEYSRNVGYSLDGQRKQTVAYDPATGRIVGMDGFVWQYLPGTDLKQSLTYPNGAVAEWEYEPQRDLLTLVSNDVFSAYAYENDAAGRRISKNTEHYGYNNRGELIAATNTAPVANYAYSFDDIGNRIVVNELGTNSAYTANVLNQYTNIVSTVEFIPEFDDDGNQTLVKTSTGIWNVTYNAENRPVMWSNETAIITMDFDRMGRRLWYKSISGAQTNAFSKFVYDGYLCVQQLDGFTGEVEQEFVWDPTETVATRPLKWTLLSLNRTFHYFHDGNKNVSDVIDASDATLAAHYEYAPFGAVTSATGPMTDANSYRFSSEWHDDQLGCVYYNYRHYNPLDGRWMSRDPIEEEGGMNLFLFCSNKNQSEVDFLGLLYLDCLGACIEQNDPMNAIIDSFIGRLTAKLALGSVGVPKSILLWIAQLKHDDQLVRAIRISMKNGSPLAYKPTKILLDWLGMNKALAAKAARSQIYVLAVYGTVLAIIEADCAIYCICEDHYDGGNILNTRKAIDYYMGKLF